MKAKLPINSEFDDTLNVPVSYDDDTIDVEMSFREMKELRKEILYHLKNNEPVLENSQLAKFLEVLKGAEKIDY